MIATIRKSLRGRLTYATVVSAISAFIVLAGGAAYAANQLAKNSVGAKQLKAKSVGSAELRKNAVTGAKIKKNAVTEAKIKSGSIGRASFDLESTPFTHVVQTATGGPVAISEELSPVPLQNAAYSQPVGRDDFFFGSATVTFAPTCEPPSRRVFVNAFVDAQGPAPDLADAVASGIGDPPAGVGTVTVPLAPVESRFRPAAAASHSLSVFAEAECENEPNGGGATVESVIVNVAGTR